MKNISITLLLNAILRVALLEALDLARGDTDHSVPLESMFSTAGCWIKNVISGTI